MNFSRPVYTVVIPLLPEIILPPIRNIMIYLDSIFFTSSSFSFVLTFLFLFRLLVFSFSSFPLTRKGNLSHVNIWIDRLGRFFFLYSCDSCRRRRRWLFISGFLLRVRYKYSNDDISFSFCCCLLLFWMALPGD